MFLKVYNELMGNREQVIADCRLMLEMLTDHTKLDAQIEKVNEEIALVSGLVSACVRENAEKVQSQDEYNKQYNGLVNRHQKAIERLEKLNAERADKVNRERELRGFIDALLTSPLVLDAWDEQLWRLLVVKAVVGVDGSVEYEFIGEKRVHVAGGREGKTGKMAKLLQ
jgi:site-specific DNA recombinase